MTTEQKDTLFWIGLLLAIAFFCVLMGMLTGN